MNPVFLPMLHLLGLGHSRQRRTRYIRLTPAAHPQHSLVLMGEDFDKPGQCLRPAVENPSRTRAAGQRQMSRYEIFDEPGFNKLRILRFEDWLEIDRIQIATLSGKIAALVKNVSDAAAHAGGKISATGSEHQDQAPGHVFATVVANSFDYSGRSGVANRKALASDSIEKRFAAGGPVEGNVADQNILLGPETGPPPPL